jgi:hypothetical protein
MNEKTKQPEPQVGDEQRRELLIKLGKVAVYTPPALLALMVSRRASADSLNNPPPPG